MTLSEGKPIDATAEARLIQEGPAFARQTRVGFVMIDRTRAPAALRDFAMRALRLQLVDVDGALELYRPGRID
jgi:hypothetical protein